jgi:hypothetical protein
MLDVVAEREGQFYQDRHSSHHEARRFRGENKAAHFLIGDMFQFAEKVDFLRTIRVLKSVVKGADGGRVPFVALGIGAEK